LDGRVAGGGDGLEPNGEACVHPRLPKIMRTDFEKRKYPKISRRMQNSDLEWLKMVEVGGFAVENGAL
jgi:hypothetical protein